MLYSIAVQLYVVTQDVEGLNNALAEVCKRCPHISLETLSERFRLRYKVFRFKY